MLGRPTAFENDDEHNYALHGLRRRNEAVVREPGWPDYFEIELALFDSEQMRTFLWEYLQYRKSPVVNDNARFEYLWEQVRSKHLRDVARRPVQLRMLAEVLPEYKGDVADLTVTSLFELFIVHLIDEVITREEGKQSRHAFSAKERREFLRDLAFWLWTADDVITKGAQVPDYVVSQYAKGDDDLESVRRDLVAGAPLDRRAGERIRFPHRSFQEYLVAEECWRRVRAESMALADVDHLMNDETALFLGLQTGRREATAALRDLTKFRGSLSRRMVQALLDGDILSFGEAELMGVPAPWLTLILGMKCARYPDNMAARERLEEVVMNVSRQHLAQGRPIKQAESEIGRMRILSLFVACMTSDGAESTILQKSRVLETFRRVVLEGGIVEQLSDRQLERRTSLFPVGERFVFDRSSSQQRLGCISNKARLLPPAARGREVKRILNGSKLTVRWLTSDAISVALAIGMNERTLDIRGLGSVFAEWLLDYAMVRDWIARSSTDRLVLAKDAPVAGTLTDGGDLASLRDGCKEISDSIELAVDARLLRKDEFLSFHRPQRGVTLSEAGVPAL